MNRKHQIAIMSIRAHVAFGKITARLWMSERNLRVLFLTTIVEMLEGFLEIHLKPPEVLKIKVAIGLIYDFEDVATLRRYFDRKQVVNEDLFSWDGGETWQPLGEIMELLDLLAD